QSSARPFFAAVAPERPGWLRVTGLQLPESPVQVGEYIKFDKPYEFRALRHQGEMVGLTVDRSGKLIHLDAEYRTRDFSGRSDTNAAINFSNVLDTITTSFSLVLGILLIWRGWGQTSAVLLGIGINALAIPLAPLPSFINSSGSAAAYIISTAILNVPLVAIFAFPAALYLEAGGRISKRWFWFFAVLLALAALELFVIAWTSYYATFPPLFGNSGALEQLLLACGAAAAIYWTFRGYRGTLGNQRGRFALLLAAYALIMLIMAVRYAFPNDAGPIEGRLPLFVLNTLFFAGFYVLVGYAVLRHKVVDLRFALNRTVVYGTVSAILLATFGIAEWAFHHLLPEEWSKASAWADAGIALTLYLTFHRLRDFVEHHLEKLFFRAWQENEAKLRRFGAAASHFENRGVLADAFAAELARFSATSVALYLLGDRGLVHAAGGWHETPAQFALDDTAFALMRAERGPLDLTETPTDLPGVLALPMLDHGTLAGFALVAAKPDGALFRPDEIEHMGWATHHVGLDLAALRGRQMEEENRRLSAQVERLSDLIGTRLSPA
ncbi:MAG: hypothetical protein VW891_01155, partial [Novosphingobium sp.]